MNRMRNPILSGILGLLLAAVVLVQLVAPPSDLARMTTFVQWLDRSMPADTASPWSGPVGTGQQDPMTTLQGWLDGLRQGGSESNDPTHWPASVWILQAWSDYYEMSDGMQATPPDRHTPSGSWTLQKSFTLPLLRHRILNKVRPLTEWNPVIQQSARLLSQPFLSGRTINAP